jgi:deazaflavin-dependent oxidoreductase (nitroreductase family)
MISSELFCGSGVSLSVSGRLGTTLTRQICQPKTMLHIPLFVAKTNYRHKQISKDAQMDMYVVEMTREQEQPQFLYLTTKGWKTGRDHKIEIWFVSYADRYYIVSEHKEKAHWVENIMHQPKVMFTVNSKSFEGTGRAVDKLAEHKLTKHISSLMDTKYGWGDGLIVELTPYNAQN